MNFQQYPVTKAVEIEGQMITVPLNTKFVSIDCFRNVQAWTERPHADEGWWVGGGYLMTVGEVTDEEGGHFDCYEIE